MVVEGGGAFDKASGARQQCRTPLPFLLYPPFVIDSAAGHVIGKHSSRDALRFPQTFAARLPIRYT